MKRRLGWRGKAILVLMGLVIPTLGIEIFARVVFYSENRTALIWDVPMPVGTPEFSDQIFLVGDHPPNVDQVRLLPPDHPYRVTTNNLGVRKSVPSKPHKDESTYRIYCLGDSFTYGTGVANDETYPHYLEETLNGLDDGRRYETLNAGVGGYGPEQEVALFLDRGHLAEPDFLIWQVLDNDIPGYHPTLRGLYARRNKGIADGTVFDDFLKTLRLMHIRNPRCSATLDWLYRLKGSGAYEALQRLAQGDDMKIDLGETTLEPETVKVIRHTWSIWSDPAFESDLQSYQAEHEKDFERLLSFARDRDLPLLILYFPTQEALQARGRGLDPVAAYYRGLTDRHGVPFLDLSEVLDAGEITKYFFLWPWDLHCSSHGNRAAAERVSEVLRKLWDEVDRR